LFTNHLWFNIHHPLSSWFRVTPTCDDDLLVIIA
jgi:hypothetical protein